MEIVTSCFGHKYLAFLAVFLRSLRNTNREKNVMVIYDDLPEDKISILKERNPEVQFIWHESLPRENGKGRRTGQKMSV